MTTCCCNISDQVKFSVLWEYMYVQISSLIKWYKDYIYCILECVCDIKIKLYLHLDVCVV